MKLLFIGNSHTYYHAMPYQCRALLAACNIEADVAQVVAPGKSLRWHGTNPETIQTLQYNVWDHVILQQATHPFAGTKPLMEGVKGLRQLMPAKQSIWLYKTWCEKDIPKNEAKIDRAFAAVSKDLDIPIIPVADVWHEVEHRDPGHNLYDADGKHAGPNGSYLTALCMTRAISGKSVQGLPAVVEYNNQIINTVSQKTASLYQSLVDVGIHT